MSNLRRTTQKQTTNLRQAIQEQTTNLRQAFQQEQTCALSMRHQWSQRPGQGSSGALLLNLLW
jgi:hypothetical protein